MSLSQSQGVWNRACLIAAHGATVDLGPGDKALGAVLLAHGMVMNGGVPHALEALSVSERDAASAGYALFGFYGIAALLRGNIDVPDDDDEADAQEEQLNAAYYTHVPDDAALSAAFERHYEKHPEAYARSPDEP